MAIPHVGQAAAQTLLEGFIEDGGKLFAYKGAPALSVSNLFDSGVI
jgi:hypothetical protein